MTTATAQAIANAAFTKYLGNRDTALHLPANGSRSMNLDASTRATVSFQHALPYDELIINGHEIAGPALERVSCLLDLVRELASTDEQEETLMNFARKISTGLDRAESDFQTRRAVIEALGVDAVLRQEEGRKTLRIKCILGKDDKEHYVLSPIVLEPLSDEPI